MIELECLAIVWATRKCRTFLAGAKFEIITDHKPLVPILTRYTLDQIENPRLLRLVMKMQMYQFVVSWRNGKDHYIADALSRAPVDEPTAEDLLAEQDDDLSAENMPTIAIVHESTDEDRTIPDRKRDTILDAASKDTCYQKLMEAVEQGFPHRRQDLIAELHPYWNIREQLWSNHGIVMKGICTVVPQELRHSALRDLHASHQGQERTKRRARQTVYWPGIGNDIENVVRNCSRCRERQSSLPKEPLISEPVPVFPFQVTAADLFTCQGSHYIVYVDVKSGWPSVYELGSAMGAGDVIIPLRRWFAEVGVPDKLKTDGGPQFTSNKFKDFCRRWQVHHEISSPHYPQSNGHAEAAVKVVKNLIYKTTTDGNLDNDAFQRGILEYRNTPREDGLSPAQVLFGRQISSFVFADHRLFSDEYQARADTLDHKSTERRAEVRDKYNQTAHPLSKLDIGTKVDVQHHKTKRWTSTGVIVAIGNRRDYFVKLPSGRVYWRNRRFLRPYDEQPNPVRIRNPMPTPTCPEAQDTKGSMAAEGETALRRSGRRKQPVHRFEIKSTSGQSYD